MTLYILIRKKKPVYSILHLLKKEKKEESSCVSARDTSSRIFKQKQGAKAV
jgi:hypothetical protein